MRFSLRRHRLESHNTVLSDATENDRLVVVALERIVGNTVDCGNNGSWGKHGDSGANRRCNHDVARRTGLVEDATVVGIGSTAVINGSISARWGRDGCPNGDPCNRSCDSSGDEAPTAVIVAIVNIHINMAIHVKAPVNIDVAIGIDTPVGVDVDVTIDASSAKRTCH